MQHQTRMGASRTSNVLCLWYNITVLSGISRSRQAGGTIYLIVNTIRLAGKHLRTAITRSFYRRDSDHERNDVIMFMFIRIDRTDKYNQ